MNRRTFLTLLGAGTTAALAGCTGQNDYEFKNIEYNLESKVLTEEDSIFVTPGKEKTSLKLTIENYGNAEALYLYIHKDDFIGQQVQEDDINYSDEWYYFAHFKTSMDNDNIGELKPPSDTDYFFRGQENGQYYGFENGNRLLITATPPAEERTNEDEEHIIEEITLENL